MGWETRRSGKRYYYEKVREGNKVVSRYLGAGRLAPIVAEINQLGQQRRQIERLKAQQARSEFAELAATPEAVTLLLEQAKSAAAAALVAAGYHQHKRQWRKKRADKNQN
jgi:hypothetical protein